jgi:hypothetical protein
LREIEIAKCNAQRYNDPRMFDDLPICVEAYKARMALSAE